MITSTVSYSPKQPKVMAKPIPKAVARPRNGILQRLLNAGFSWGAPSHISMDILTVDEQFCRRARCRKCRHLRLRYYPLHRGPEYRAVQECHRCLHADRVPVGIFAELAGPGVSGEVTVIDEFGGEVVDVA